MLAKVLDCVRSDGGCVTLGSMVFGGGLVQGSQIGERWRKLALEEAAHTGFGGGAECTERFGVFLEDLYEGDSRCAELGYRFGRVGVADGGAFVERGKRGLVLAIGSFESGCQALVCFLFRVQAGANVVG